MGMFRRLTQNLLIVFSVANPLSAQITIGPFTFDPRDFADTAIQLEPELLPAFCGGATSVADALVGYSPTKGVANSGSPYCESSPQGSSQCPNLYRMGFTDVRARNGDGVDIVLFESFSPDPYAVSVRYESFFTPFVSFPSTAMVRTFATGPTCSGPANELFALPIDLDAFGLEQDAIVDAIEFYSLPYPGAESPEGDPVMAAVVSGRYVALGDSFASGEGSPPYFGQPDGCHRSQHAYVINAGIGGINGGKLVACSGAKTINVLPASAGGVQGKHGEPPQLDDPSIGTRTRLITISIGGNDAKFSWALAKCAGFDSGLNCLKKNTFLFSFVSMEEHLETLIEVDVRRDLDTTLSAIVARTSPDTSVVLIGYPIIFPEAFCLALAGFTLDEQKGLNRLTRLLNEQLSKAAAAAGVSYLDVTPVFRGHEVCGRLWPWIHAWRYPLVESFHPNSVGHWSGYKPLVDPYTEGQPTPASAPSGRRKVPVAPARLHAPSLPTIDDLQIAPSGPAPSCSVKGFAAGQELTLAGNAFATFSEVTLVLSSMEDSPSVIGTITADGTGNIAGTVTIPANAMSSAVGLLEAHGNGSNGQPRLLFASFTLQPPLGIDADLDAVPDACDLCPQIGDPAQEDADLDGLGDACDLCPLDPQNDVDGDGLCEDQDPCPFYPDNTQDEDGLCVAPIPFLFADGFELGGTTAWSNTVQ